MDRSWKTTTRYYPFSRYLRETFGCPVRKVPVNGGFGCPNRDGTIGRGGCTFCVNAGFSPVAGGNLESLGQQVRRAIDRAHRQGFGGKFLVYFQPFTNTHGSVDVLRRRYDEAVAQAEVVGLAVGTRPDCVPEPVLDLLQSYTDRYQVWVEYGVQSAHDTTLARIHRGHDWATTVDALTRTRARGLLVCAHLILGLPGETRDHIRETACRLAEAGCDGVKLHQLAVVRGAPLEADYRRGAVSPLSCEEYVSLAADVLERLPETVVVQRLVGDTYGDLLVAPKWAQTKSQVLSAVTTELKRRGTWQGARTPAALSEDGSG